MSKQWYKSKAIWSAILKALAGVITSIALIFSGDLVVIDFLPGLITAVWGIYDMIVRYKTGIPIAGSRLYYRMKNIK